MAERVLTRRIDLAVLADLEGKGGGMEPALWEYDPKEPFAVRVVFLTAEVAWSFGRNLLAEGLEKSSGDLDVIVWPEDRKTLGIRLSSPDGTAYFEAPKRPVREFLLDLYALVKRGNEEMDFTEAIDEIFRRAVS